jgi:hypothetical protein
MVSEFVRGLDNDEHTALIDSADCGFIKYRLWSIRGDNLIAVEYPHEVDDVVLYTDELDVDLQELLFIEYISPDKYSIKYLDDSYTHSESVFTADEIDTDDYDGFDEWRMENFLSKI